MAAEVLLVDGPADGKRLLVDDSRRGSVVIEGVGVPDGHVARYRPTRDAGVWRFRGIERLIARFPFPAKEAGS